MDDLAEVVITQLQLDDVASNLELRVAGGCDYAHIEYTPHGLRFCVMMFSRSQRPWKLAGW